MDHREPPQHSLPSSSILNLQSNSNSEEVVVWDNVDEFELMDSDEQSLFLNENYASLSNQQQSHVKLPSLLDSPADKGHLPNGDLTGQNAFNPASTNRSHEDNDNFFDDDQDYSITNDREIESIQLLQQDKQNNINDNAKSTATPTPSSIVYRTPNYQQFAGNLAPSSPISVLVSLIIITVILCVTIFPIVFLPQSTTKDNKANSFDNVIEQNGIAKSTAQQVIHSDFRCKCVCPPETIMEVKSNSTKINKNNDKNGNHEETSKLNATKQTLLNGAKRRLYVGNTSPDKCNCNNIVQSHLKNDRILLKDFCLRCECRYQSRNTTTIRRNVIFFIVVLMILGLYSLIQYLLKYLRITKKNIPHRFRWIIHQISEND